MKFLSLACLFFSCAIASDSSRRSSESSRSTTDKFDFSYLDEVEGVQSECADVARTIISSMAKIPNMTVRGERLFRCTRSSAINMHLVGKVAREVRPFLPSGSVAIEKIDEIENVSRGLESEIDSYYLKSMYERKKPGSSNNGSTNKDYSKYIDFRVQSVRYILSAVKEINLSVFSFERLYQFVKFLIDFYLLLDGDENEYMAVFAKKIEALRKRKAVLDLRSSTVDWENIEPVYEGYSKELLQIMNDIFHAPKGTKIWMCSKRFQLLAKAVGDLAYLAADPNGIMGRIEKVVKKESETIELDRARTEMITKKSSSDTSRINCDS